MNIDRRTIPPIACERQCGARINGWSLPALGKAQAAISVAVLLAVAFSTGCHRTFYRRQADIEAYALVKEKANHPHWNLPDYTISIDPRSRMYDPYAIDCPPMPADDATAQQLMQCVDNKRGWPFWHDNGERAYVENPAWPEFIEVEKGVLQLSGEDAVRLALLHSRTYQQQLETLYLSALDVSAQRFVFDTQAFAGYSIFGDWFGPDAPSGGGNSRSNLTLSTFNNGGPRWSLRRTFSTGSTLAVNFANSLIWQFSGPDDYHGISIIDFSLIQPLLRDAGRDRILEPLTQSERTLLNNVRAMEQFRQGFYVNVMTGGNTGVGPVRGGGAGQLANGVTGGGSAPGGVGNYMGLLQSQRRILNQEDNVRRLRRNLGRLTTQRDVQPQERTSDYLSQLLQVAQARQALLSAESTLVTLRNNYQSDLDSFKVDILSLPPYVCFESADDMLRPFELIDQDIIRLPEDWETILTSQVAARREIPERIQSNIEEVQSVIISGSPTGGTYTLIWTDAVGQPQAIAPLPFNATGEEVQAALRMVPGLESVTVSSIGTSPNYTHIILFSAAARTKQLLSTSELTGGTSPKITHDSICRLKRYEGLEADLAMLRPALAEMQKFADRIVSAQLPAIQKDLQAFRDALPRRKLWINKLAERIAELLGSPCELLPLAGNPLEAVGGGATAAELLGRVERSLAEAERSYQLLSGHFQGYATALGRRGRLTEEILAARDQTPEQLFEQIVQGIYNPNYECGRTRILTIDVVEEMTRELTELQLLQAICRTESIELQDIDIRADQAVEVARKYRRDWMNARAQLVDGWRQIQFTSDQLQSSLSILFSGDVRNLGDNPFNFRTTTGSLRAGVQFDAPLTRLLERNNYRLALINYQQARRNYYRFEDQVGQLLRDHLRTVTANQLNFELQRLAVIQAAQQVMLNVFIDQESQRALATRATAARDSVQALGDLLNAQNAYLAIWINYEVLRISLDFNLGTMQLDSEGLWMDPGSIGKNYGQNDPWLAQTEGAAGLEALPPTKEANPIDQLPPAFMLPTPPADASPEGSLQRLLPGPPLPGRN